jgi:hypothetical protein
MKKNNADEFWQCPICFAALERNEIASHMKWHLGENHNDDHMIICKQLSF